MAGIGQSAQNDNWTSLIPLIHWMQSAWTARNIFTQRAWCHCEWCFYSRTPCWQGFYCVAYQLDFSTQFLAGFAFLTLWLLYFSYLTNRTHKRRERIVYPSFQLFMKKSNATNWGSFDDRFQMVFWSDIKIEIKLFS
jgi:hypothetical protein